MKWLRVTAEIVDENAAPVPIFDGRGVARLSRSWVINDADAALPVLPGLLPEADPMREAAE